MKKLKKKISIKKPKGIKINKHHEEKSYTENLNIYKHNVHKNLTGTFCEIKAMRTSHWVSKISEAEKSQNFKGIVHCKSKLLI
ncbi:hypothetical protein GDO86_017298 [Hymenochirus boettgeri]|uniref:Uncharacterized protein n=1 Tax=Hymenochirus boettgeri TaxID=247094 RepID=A0A8T2IMG6_9PIPI|nr:hypothetical protein GDO86_017298 [Hymenochirus boettgeri]